MGKPKPWSEKTEEEKARHREQSAKYRERERLGIHSRYSPRESKRLTSEQEENMRIWADLGINDPGEDRI